MIDYDAGHIRSRLLDRYFKEALFLVFTFGAIIRVALEQHSWLKIIQIGYVKVHHKPRSITACKSCLLYHQNREASPSIPARSL